MGVPEPALEFRLVVASVGAELAASPSQRLFGFEQGGEDVLVGQELQNELDSLQVRREFDVVPGKEQAALRHRHGGPVIEHRNDTLVAVPLSRFRPCPGMGWKSSFSRGGRSEKPHSFVGKWVEK